MRWKACSVTRAIASSCISWRAGGGLPTTSEIWAERATQSIADSEMMPCSGPPPLPQIRAAKRSRLRIDSRKPRWSSTWFG
ncbi:hypothetical protein BWR60_21595 [Inquilinus limosus]|uniref:Uncharacterized protein n=1 Tax=Inquilinus limosus TaxID=171674 RepID=A0A211ZIH4_9PROT|nr:hypothetical protein BWR60_21595 [Inquilinus limosus]